ncbi:MAG: tRNA (adenosine(37)-N6)-threonylcarbamoyltransferase complex dimerization subunit type 1 TsaB [Flavobacteriia bacterium]|nr:tRNA (adenosine(37)-N6)-threonylcarbamoyltransferase complex dimerization subunit type 1 TsaB [Flavobacteriia bacterium]
MTFTVLSIETSTLNCSVAIHKDGQLLSCVEESSSAYIHGEKLHLFIDQCIAEAEIQIADLTAVAVSKGPGSYTGLRIGVSAAKGLAFSLDIPLYSVDSLDVLANAIHLNLKEDHLILANIDARRMEIYGAFYNSDGTRLTDISADVVEEDIYSEIHKGRKVILAGDAQEKLLSVLPGEIYSASEVNFPSAKDMGALIQQKIEQGKNEDVAYFEPFYLKDFVAGKPRKSPLDL